LYYFSSLMKHAEALNNSELLAKSRELELVHLAVQVCLVNQQQYPPEAIREVLLGLAALADNEDFRPNWEDFFALDTAFGSAADKKAHFLMVEEQLCTPYLKELEASDTQNKTEEARKKTKELRPLLDFFKLLKRSM